MTDTFVTTAAGTVGTVNLRRARERDRDFLIGVYASTREELGLLDWADGPRQAFIATQFAAREQQYRQLNPTASVQVIEVGRRPAGRLYIDRRPVEIRIIDIALLPQFRGAGVGGYLLARLIEEAFTSERTLSIHVEPDNRSAGLYSRMGFVTVAEHGRYHRMEWRAA
ncbi:MAG: GNAT family N-acetyltransferase [Pseudonocardiales bacterium]|nr:GNAT family N-acetyltransferase [Actinomycetota bacterium]